MVWRRGEMKGVRDISIFLNVPGDENCCCCCGEVLGQRYGSNVVVGGGAGGAVPLETDEKYKTIAGRITKEDCNPRIHTYVSALPKNS